MSWARNSVGERGDNIGLPDVTTADNGKIMEVESGEWKLKEGSGGGGGLPEITESDEGKFLTVESGEAAWASGGGGGSVPVPDIEEDYGKTIIVGDDGYELQYPYMLREMTCPITTNENISLPANSPIVFATVEADMTDYPDDMAMYQNANYTFIGQLSVNLPLYQKIICNRYYTDSDTPNSIFFEIIIFRTDTSATESLNPSTVNMIMTVVIETNE